MDDGLGNACNKSPVILVSRGLKVCWKAGRQFPELLAEVDQKPSVSRRQLPRHRSPSMGGIPLLCTGRKCQALLPGPVWITPRMSIACNALGCLTQASGRAVTCDKANLVPLAWGGTVVLTPVNSNSAL